jgi:hypothetical protein
MSSPPMCSEGQSKEQALAASSGDLRAYEAGADSDGTGDFGQRQPAATPCTDFASRRSPFDPGWPTDEVPGKRHLVNGPGFLVLRSGALGHQVRS